MIKWRCVVAVLLIGLVPMALLAEPPMSLQVRGAVQVNGKPAQADGVIFPGDRLQVGPASSATLTGNGLHVTVDSEASLIYNENAIDLSCGELTVATTRGTVVRTIGRTVTPADKTAKFYVGSGKDGLTISALEGNLLVDSGSGTPLTIAPGQKITNKETGSGCGEVQTRAPGAVFPYGAAAVTGAAAGLAIYCLTGHGWCKEPITPSKP